MTRIACPRRSGRSLGGAVLLLVVAGCGLLDTQDPDIIDAEDLNTPEGAQARRVGAISDFAAAKDGGIATEGQILLSGLMSDEFLYAATDPSAQDIDQRAVNETNISLSFLYSQLHRARTASEEAARALQTAVPDPDVETGIPELLSLAGFTYIYLAEDFCSGVPISLVVGDSLVFGNSIPTAAMYDTALARFDSALAHPALGRDPNIDYLARVGRARVLVDQGQFEAAAAQVIGVPTDFQYLTEHAESPDALQNVIFLFSIVGLWSVADGEGGIGLSYRTADDPRVPFVDTGDVGLDGSTPQFSLLKYPDISASVVVADGVEARLIEAEAQLRGADTAAMLMTLNTLRGGIGLEDLSGPATLTEAEDMLFRERAFWLFATGHRLGDMRRLIRQYGRTEASVFPVGPYPKGGNYGSDLNLPIPFEEQNNPNFHGCIDRIA